MRFDIDWSVLDRHVAGEATPQESRLMHVALRAQPALLAVVGALRRVSTDHGGPPLEAWNTEAALQRVQRRVREEQAGNAHVGSTARRHPTLGRALVVGSLGVGVLVAMLLVSTFVTRTPGPGVERRWASSPRAVTARGQRTRINLVDGTQVMLAPESKLLVVESVDRGGARTVGVEGEAYFRVAPLPGRPFRIYAGRGVVEVLGTEFTVRAYDNDSSVRVVVIDGQVAFSVWPPGTRRGRRPVALRRGDIATLGTRDSITLARSQELRPYIGWVEGTLDFDDLAFADVALQLERWYDVDIEVADSAIGRQRVTAAFRDRSLSNVLAALCGAIRVRCEQEGRRVIVSE